MNWHKQTIRVGILAVLTAMLLRYAGSDLFGHALGIFSQPRLASFLIYSETGRKPELPQETTAPATAPTTLPAPTQPTASSATQPSAPATPRLSFRPSDVSCFGIRYACSYRPDLQALLLQQLQWDLTGDEPAILIIHTHGTEAYTPTADTLYQSHAAYRTTDTRYNVISMGDELTRLLQEAGLSVIHDRTAYDYLDYENAYVNSRAAVQAYLKQYPSIQMVLDLHRDAAENADGSQWASSATVDGTDSAQLMFVVGTDALGDRHPDWQTNLSIAEKLTVLAEKTAPGLCRHIDLRAKRYNQDLASGALIVEVGSAGNTHAEAMNAIPVLAQAVIKLAGGTE